MLSVLALARLSLRRTVALTLCVLSLLVFVSPAWGQSDPDQLKKARAQFQQATEMEQAGNYSAALQIFREVGQVKMTPQVRFHIALCEEKLGKLVAALGGYELALADAEAVGPAFKQEVETTVTALRARIPKIVIQRGPGAQAAEIDLDGVTLGASSIGVESPIDPGPHTITATARGFKDFETTVTFAEQETREVKVELEALPLGERESREGGQGRGPGPADAGKKNAWVPWVVGGAGLAALLVAGGFLLMKESKVNAVESACKGSNECDLSGINGENLRAARTYRDVAIGMGIAGGALVVTGVVIYFWPSKKTAAKKPKAAALHLEPSAPATQAGLSLVGRF